MNVVLPWPPKDLSPNARVHWSRRSKAAKAYRAACWAACLEAGLRSIAWEGEIHLWISFVPPDRRHRDDDNMISAFKSGRDGLADALKVDDKRFRIHPEISDKVGGTVNVRFSQHLTGNNSQPLES